MKLPRKRACYGRGLRRLPGEYMGNARPCLSGQAARSLGLLT